MKRLSLLTLLLFTASLPAWLQAQRNILENSYPKEQKAIQKQLDGIFQAIKDGDDDKLISYHVYSDKFTEFRNDGPLFGSEENEAYERGFVNGMDAFDYNLGGLKINVFDDMAIVTFEADFRPTIEGTVHQIWANVTLVFLKHQGEWKITHEHFSQFEKTG